MVSLSRRACVLLPTVAFSLALAACGGGGADGNSSATEASAQAASFLNGLPAEDRTAIERELEQTRAAMDGELAKIKAMPEPDQTRALGIYVAAGLNQVYKLEGELQRLENPPSGGLSDPNSKFEQEQDAKRAVNIARRKAYIAMGRGHIDQVVAGNPLLQEAVKRHLASKTPAGRYELSVGDATLDLLKEPCTFAKAEGASTSPVAMRGIALGMTRAQAISAVCEAQQGKLRVLSDAKNKTFDDNDALEFGAYLTAMSRFRAGQGTFTDIGTRLMDGIRSDSGQIARREYAKEYLSRTALCLNCADAQRAHDTLTLSYLPDGKIASIKREQRFMAATTDAGKVIEREAPQPLQTILGALQKQYGEPSFAAIRNDAVLYAWVRPDGGAALPPERWIQERIDTGTRMGMSPSVSLNGNRLTDVAGNPVVKLVAARNPRASYCVFQNKLLPGDMLDWRITAPFFYGSPVKAWPGQDRPSKEIDRLTLPYDRALEPPGYMAKCGKVMVAELKRHGLTSTTAKDPVVGPQSPIYDVELILRDLDAEQAFAVAQVGRITERVGAVDKRIDKAASGSAGFTP